MTNPYDVYEKSTYQKVSQMRGWDSGGDFAVSFGCESCFSSETQSLCVAQSKSVPNMVVIMRIFREKWLRSSIGRSQGVRSPASLSKWGGEPVYLNMCWASIVWNCFTCNSHAQRHHSPQLRTPVLLVNHPQGNHQCPPYHQNRQDRSLSQKSLLRKITMKLTWDSVFAQQNAGDPMPRFPFFSLGKESKEFD